MKLSLHHQDKQISRNSHTLCAGIVLSLLTGCIGGAGDSVTGPDPGIIDFPIAYVKRPYPLDNQGNPLPSDLADPLQASVGGDLYIRDRSSLSAGETNITGAITQGLGDVRDVEVSYDGNKLIFSLRLFDSNTNSPPTPRWNIYEYDVTTATLQKVMSDATSELGDDVAPHYLPDGRIVFASNRQVQSKAVLTTESISKPVFSALDEGEDAQALVLHLMDESGSSSSIQQISSNQSHDLDPTVLSGGEILFSRWDNIGSGNGAVHLYKIMPDGSGLAVVYGAHSHDTGSDGSTVHFLQSRPLPNGNIMAIIRPFSGTYGGGDIVEIDVSAYIDIDQALALYQGALTGPAQTPATINTVITDGSPSPAGRYSAVYPLWDGSNRMLVSKSFCSLDINGTSRACIEPWLGSVGAQEMTPEYTIWIYDLSDHTEKLVVSVERGMIISDVVAVQSRPLPVIAGGSTLNASWESEGVGALHIRSVYDFDGSFNSLGSGAADIASLASAESVAAQRPARFLRLVKAVGIPDPDDEDVDNLPDLAREAFGPNRAMGMREILGYVPIEPDGSVMVKMPANVPVTVDILDESGRRISNRHNNWLQVRPGETLECNGCHSHQTQGGATPLPHGRSDAQVAAVNIGAGTTLPLPMPSGLKTVPQLYALTDETMAKVRYNRCNLDMVGCSATTASIDPTIDPIYNDIWTDPNDISVTVNASFSYPYADMVGVSEIFATADDAPTSGACQGAWQKNCRIVINYEAHIHPLWAKERGANTCITCHTTNHGAQVPEGQLDLTGGVSDENARHIESYRDLLFTDNRQVLNPDLQDQLIQTGVDTTTDPETPIFSFVSVPPSMSQNGARASYFMEKLTETELNAGRVLSTAGSDPAYVDHSSFLLPSELRLIAEWLDIGAQYYNNPFAPTVPQN